ncbi:MAG: hypothetical protein CMC08_03565 [Flavobacteriaceae bacterium]|mgnify:CR=1 FL=1|nr:hypothetical protein [Flavobacteriaceae bacterium]
MKTTFPLLDAPSTTPLFLKLIFLTTILFILPSTLMAQYVWPAYDSNNIAQFKPTKQINTYEAAAANRAVDGNTNGNWFEGSMSHTHGSKNPWWEVDLLDTYDISSITIYNRTDCCPERINNFSIIVSDRSLGNGTRFNTDSQFFRDSKTFTGNARGQFVRVQLEGDGILGLAEVVVNGTLATKRQKPDANLALGKPARQSGTTHNGAAHLANDGNTDGHYYMGSVTHTENIRNPFWEVDLGKNYLVEKVTLANRTDAGQDRLQNFDIWVTPEIRDPNRNIEPFYSQKDRLEEPIVEFISPTKKFGRFVRVQLRGNNILNLAEVQVYGQEIGELEQDLPTQITTLYTVSTYNNGLEETWPQSSEVATSITEGFDFSRSEETNSSNYWEVSAEVKTSVSVLLHNFDVTLGAKGGGSTSNTQTSNQGLNFAESKTETRADQIPVPANSTVYKIVEFRVAEKPFIYHYGGKSYKFYRIMDKFKPVGAETVLVYPFNYNPGFVFDDDRRISKANYDKILAEYPQKRKPQGGTNTTTTVVSQSSNTPGNVSSNVNNTTNTSMVVNTSIANTNTNTNNTQIVNTSQTSNNTTVGSEWPDEPGYDGFYEILFYPSDDITLEEAKQIATQNSWELASDYELQDAWEFDYLHIEKCGLLADGRIALPIQEPYLDFEPGANIGLATTVVNGFFYTVR